MLDRDAGDYRATLDGNEQYDNVEGIAELWRRMRETPALARLVAATLFIEQPIKRAAALAKSVDAAGAPEAADHRRVGWRAGVLPGGAEARLQRRLQQELQGSLQIDPQCRARRQAQRRGRRAEVFHVGRGPHHAGRRERAAGPGAGVAAGPRPTSSATAIISSTACRSRPSASRRPSPRAHPDLYEPRRRSGAPAHRRRPARSSARSPARALPWPPTWISRPCGRCRRAPQGAHRARQPREGRMSAERLPERFESVAALEDFMTRADAGAGRRPRRACRATS